MQPAELNPLRLGCLLGFTQLYSLQSQGSWWGPPTRSYEVPGEVWFPGAFPDSPVPRSSVRLARATGEPFPLVDLDNYQSAQPHRWAVEKKSRRFTKPPFSFLWMRRSTSTANKHDLLAGEMLSHHAL